MRTRKVESLQDTFRKCESREYDHDVEDLMASAPDIEFPLTPSLRYLLCVNDPSQISLQRRTRAISTYFDSVRGGTSNIQHECDDNPEDAHPLILNMPSISIYSMKDRHHCAECQTPKSRCANGT
jgi:hypothetical protein